MTKLKTIQCPSCGGSIKADIKNNKTIFCAYCGNQIEVDNGIKETIHTKNVNVHKTYTDEADIIRAKNEKNSDKILLFCFIIVILLPIGMLVFPWLFNEFIPSVIKQIEISTDGKITAGSHTEYEGKNYIYVRATLEASGFSNFELIELNDEWLFVKDGDVTNVSIAGNSTFNSDDRFDKDSKVVIMYH